MRPRTTFFRKETMELLKRFLQSLALVLFMLAMLAMLALGALGIYLFHLPGVWMAHTTMRTVVGLTSIVVMLTLFVMRS